MKRSDPPMEHRTLRAYFSLASAMLFALLILLAGTSGFLRNTAGDFFVVLLLYALARTVKPVGLRILPLLLFGFAVTVEVLQYVDVVALLGIENENVQIAVGSVFDWGDIAVYGLAAFVAAGVDFWIERKTRQEGEAQGKISVVSMLCLAMCALCILSVIHWGLICYEDYQSLCNSPETSGIDFFMIGASYAIGFFPRFIGGLLLSVPLYFDKHLGRLSLLAYLFTLVFGSGIVFSCVLFFYSG